MAAWPLDTALWLVRGARAAVVMLPQHSGLGVRLQGLYEYFPASWWRVLLGTLDRNCKQKMVWTDMPPPSPAIHLLLNQFFKGLGRDVLMQTMMYQKQTRGGKKNNTCFAIPLYLLHTFTLCIHLVNTSITHDNNTRMAHDKIWEADKHMFSSKSTATLCHKIYVLYLYISRMCGA